ncbi:hypothetical protein [Streptomyces sp. NPDC050856]|uniref:hypothetical protein n=1 Tax=Streptomyces sp. NPDC050856 TaxID=3154939 RepID=UPI0033D82A62
MTTLDGVRTAKQELSANLANDPRVRYLGVGFEGDEYVIMVAVADPEARPDLPDVFHGVPVRVIEAAEFTAQAG